MVDATALMSPVIAILADDLTGAADTAVAFRRVQLRTTLMWDVPEPGGPQSALALRIASAAQSESDRC